MSLVEFVSEFTPLASTIGGVLIGLAAALLFGLRGRTAGISGITGGLFEAPGDRGWRAAFVLGLLGGGVLTAVVAPAAFGTGVHPVPLPLVAIGGLLVGIGTRLGRGCTSGHGVCGISRGAKSSIVATCVFMAVGMLTVCVLRHVLGGGA